jgi:hypothetical protein
MFFLLYQMSHDAYYWMAHRQRRQTVSLPTFGTKNMGLIPASHSSLMQYAVCAYASLHITMELCRCRW